MSNAALNWLLPWRENTQTWHITTIFGGGAHFYIHSTQTEFERLVGEYIDQGDKYADFEEFLERHMDLGTIDSFVVRDDTGERRYP